MAMVQIIKGACFGAWTWKQQFMKHAASGLNDSSQGKPEHSTEHGAFVLQSTAIKTLADSLA
jgi:hypothetical protein